MSRNRTLFADDRLSGNTGKTAAFICCDSIYLVIFFCVMSNLVAAAQTVPVPQDRTAIVFFTDHPVNDRFWTVLYASLGEDLAADTGELPDGSIPDRNPAFFRSADLSRGIPYTDVIEVKLIGRCDILPQANRPMSTGPLGWVLRVSTQIQPFVSIDCTRIVQVIGPAVRGMNREQRLQAMSQAISHVLIHEWIHFAHQSSFHGDHGITQATLSVEELIASPKHCGHDPNCSHMIASNHKANK